MPNPEYVRRIVAQKPFGWTYRDPSEIFSFSFEELDLFWWHNFVGEYWKCAIYAGVFYVVTIFGLQRWMRDRPAMDLKRPLFYWNFVLGIFSIAGFIRMLPGFTKNLLEPNGFYDSICVKKGLDIPTAFWTVLFILSKYLELGDTVFIVLRKRPLIFLQWYHHLVTMSVTWILAPLVEPISRWYTVLNYGVHSLMYPYFAARAMDVRVPAKFSKLITTLQFGQMIIGFSVNMASIYYQQAGNCVRYPISIQLFGFVYGSFLLLFGNLFYDLVIKNGRAKKLKLRKETEITSNGKKVN